MGRVVIYRRPRWGRTRGRARTARRGTTLVLLRRGDVPRPTLIWSPPADLGLVDLSLALGRFPTPGPTCGSQRVTLLAPVLRHARALTTLRGILENPVSGIPAHLNARVQVRIGSLALGTAGALVLGLACVEAFLPGEDRPADLAIHARRVAVAWRAVRREIALELDPDSATAEVRWWAGEDAWTLDLTASTAVLESAGMVFEGRLPRELAMEGAARAWLRGMSEVDAIEAKAPDVPRADLERRAGLFDHPSLLLPERRRRVVTVCRRLARVQAAILQAGDPASVLARATVAAPADPGLALAAAWARERAAPLGCRRHADRARHVLERVVPPHPFAEVAARHLARLGGRADRGLPCDVDGKVVSFAVVYPEYLEPGEQSTLRRAVLGGETVGTLLKIGSAEVFLSTSGGQLRLDLVSPSDTVQIVVHRVEGDARNLAAAGVLDPTVRDWGRSVGAGSWELELRAGEWRGVVPVVV